MPKRKTVAIPHLALLFASAYWSESVVAQTCGGCATTVFSVMSDVVDPNRQVFVQHTQTALAENSIPIWAEAITKCPGCIGRGYYAQGNIDSGSSIETWMINFESSPFNKIGDFGYQVGATAVNSNHDVTTWSGALSIGYRASAGIGGAYGCTSGTNCFPAAIAFDVIPNGTQFHTGLAIEMGATIDRDILLRSEAWAAIEIWNKAGSTRNVGIIFAPAGTINVGIQYPTGSFGIGLDFAGGSYSTSAIRWPTSFAGGGARVLCVDNNGLTFRGATSSSCL